jgi:hypothetical protein
MNLEVLPNWMEPEDEAAYTAYCIEQFERQQNECGATLITGPAHDQYHTSCDQPNGHYPKTQHQGPDPYGETGVVTWGGGGMCAGDPLPYRDVVWHLQEKK